MGKKYWKKTKWICVGMIPLLILSKGTPVHAEINEEENLKEIKEKIITATELFEDVLKNQYEEKMEESKSYIRDHDYNYELSMESLYEKDSPFKDADYLSVIAAYLSVTKNDLTVYDVTFLDIDYEKKTFEDFEPVKYYTYTDNGDGTYSRGDVYYLTEPGQIGEYEEIEPDVYKKTGEIVITPEVTEKTYCDITLRLKTAEELLDEYGTEKDKEDYERRIELLKKSEVSEEGLTQSIMLSHIQDIPLEEDQQLALTNAITNTGLNRQTLIMTAQSLIGKVPYMWGGKSSMPGIDPTWWTIGEDGRQKGLDCSGYVSWAFRTAGYDKYYMLQSTAAILANTEPISAEELQPGDIGLLNYGETTNHTGIYVGDGYFLHCSSEKNTVVMARYPFCIFRRVKDFDIETLDETIPNSLTEPGTWGMEATAPINDPDLYLLAQLVCNEARGQGYNGWVAVAEVVMNRVESPLFANTIRDVIYSPGQFADSDRIATQVPSPEILATVQDVMQGNVRILNNKDVLFFRNPHGEGDGNWGTHQTYMRINDHVFYMR